MTALNRYRVKWSGFPGAPGVSTFFSVAPVDLTPALHAFFFSIRVLLPLSVRIDVESSGDIIADETGMITGTWSFSPEAQVAGDTAGVYSAPSGCVVNWKTGTVINGSRLRGKTFVVPLAGSTYQEDGSINPTSLGIVRGAASVLAATGDLQVWHRPTTVGAADGSHGQVAAAVVNDMVAVLRSRRD